MTPGPVNPAVVETRLSTLSKTLAGIDSLPLETEKDFLLDRRMVAAGESYLFHALVALFDLGRHLLAKGFGIAATECRQVPAELCKAGLLDSDLAEGLTRMAGYRNRMVHFSAEVTPEELYSILTEKVDEIRAVRDAMTSWIRDQA
jgi:uncharacterized protein YutE (UPF0331/DUF86 family)